MLIAETGIVGEGVAIAVTGTTFVEDVAALIPVTGVLRHEPATTPRSLLLKGIAFEGVVNALTGTAFAEVYGLAIAWTGS